MRAGALIELVDREEALRLDEGLVRLARSETGVRLAMGDAFVALENGWQELGFSSFEAYVRERCVRSARWARDTRALARRLAVLPHIRARLMRGTIGWSMAELLARYATADDEEELLEATKGMTVRQVRRAMRERGDVPEPVEERIGTLELSCTFEEVCALVATQPMAELVAGKGVGAWLEGLLGEAQDWLTIVAPHADPMPEDVIAKHQAWLASIARGEQLADRREARADAGLPSMPEVPLSPVDQLPSGPNPIDRVLFRDLAPRLASSDVRFGELLAKFFAVRGWRVLGFASEKQYADERLGMSRSSVRARIALWRRVVHLQRLGDALRDGVVGYEAATLIARVATPDTEEAWIERARRRTFKHLAEEVHAVEMIGQMMRLEDPPGPPDEAEVALAQSIERDFVSGAYARRAFGMERGEEDEAPSVDDASSSPYAEMARAARVVQEQLRTVIEVARARSGAMTEADVLAACVGLAEPVDALPMRDLEDDLVWTKGAPELTRPGGLDAGGQMSGGVGGDGKSSASAIGADVIGQMSGGADRIAEGPARAAGVDVIGQMSGGGLSTAPSSKVTGWRGDRELEGGEDETRRGGEARSNHRLSSPPGLLASRSSSRAHACAGGDPVTDSRGRVLSAGASSQMSGGAARVAEGSGRAASVDVIGQMSGGAADADAAGQMSGGEARDAVGQMSGGAAGDEPSVLSPALTAMVCEPGDEEKLAERVRDGWKPRWPKVLLRLRAPEWVILHFRQLEAAFHRSGCGGSFAQFAVLGFWAVWAPVLGQSNECEPITRRDRYVCTCPVCGRPAGPWHHVQPKAHGGGDEKANLTSPCPWCHLDGVHLGRIRVVGEAPGELVWTIGRTPIMEVRGREKRLAA